MTMMELRQVEFSYRGGQPVLRGVDAVFESGRFYALVGKSGAGKSTLLSLMAGLERPTAGEILLEGESILHMDPNEYRRRRISVIYQDFALFPMLTVLENILYPMELCRVPADRALQEAESLAAKVALPQKLWHSYPTQISGGEQQRVAIARGLTMNRRLMLADEPTGNLDSENSDIVIDLLQRLAHEEQRCVIAVTHDLSVMDRADTVYRLVDGRLTPPLSRGLTRS